MRTLTVAGQVDSDLSDKNLKENDEEGDTSIDESKAAPVVIDFSVASSAVKGNDTLQEEHQDDDFSGNLDVLHDGRQIKVHQCVADIASLVVFTSDGCDQPDAETETDDPCWDSQVSDHLGVSGEGPATDQHGAFGRDSEQLVDNTSDDCNPSARNRKALIQKVPSMRTQSWLDDGK